MIFWFGTIFAYQHDPHVTAVVGELTVRSPAFGDYWARREVRPRTNEHKHLHHHQVGVMDLRYQAFNVADAPGQQIFVYTAAPGSPSADALHLLHRFIPTLHDPDNAAAGTTAADHHRLDATSSRHKFFIRARLGHGLQSSWRDGLDLHARTGAADPSRQGVSGLCRQWKQELPARPR